MLVDGNDYGVFPSRGDRASLPAPLEEAQHSLRKRLGHLPQHVVRHCVQAGVHLNFLDSRQGSFELGEGQRGVNRPTVVRLRVRVVDLHFTTALAHVRRQTVAVTRLGESFGERIRLGLVRAVDAVTLP